MIEQIIERYEYDEEGDVLDIYFDEKRPAWTIELTDHIMLSLDRQTQQVVALSFLDFTELIRPTPLGPRSFPLISLADLPLIERDWVVKALLTPPVNAWLDVSSVQSLPNSPLALTHLKMPPPEVLRLISVSTRSTDIPLDSLTAPYQGSEQSPLSVAELAVAYETTSYETILNIIHHWPPAHRLRLMQDILKSLPPEPTPAQPRRRTLPQALGLLATDQPPPSDAEVEQWLAEHRLEKYG